jgi:hypothetical protein
MDYHHISYVKKLKKKQKQQQQQQQLIENCGITIYQLQYFSYSNFLGKSN